MLELVAIITLLASNVYTLVQLRRTERMLLNHMDTEWRAAAYRACGYTEQQAVDAAVQEDVPA